VTLNPYDNKAANNWRIYAQTQIPADPDPFDCVPNDVLWSLIRHIVNTNYEGPMRVTRIRELIVERWVYKEV
jgi:hypothetical protein